MNRGAALINLGRCVRVWSDIWHVLFFSDGKRWVSFLTWDRVFRNHRDLACFRVSFDRYVDVIQTCVLYFYRWIEVFCILARKHHWGILISPSIFDTRFSVLAFIGVYWCDSSGWPTASVSVIGSNIHSYAAIFLRLEAIVGYLAAASTITWWFMWRPRPRDTHHRWLAQIVETLKRRILIWTRCWLYFLF